MGWLGCAHRTVKRECFIARRRALCSEYLRARVRFIAASAGIIGDRTSSIKQHQQKTKPWLVIDYRITSTRHLHEPVRLAWVHSGPTQAPKSEENMNRHLMLLLAIEVRSFLLLPFRMSTPLINKRCTLHAALCTLHSAVSHFQISDATPQAEAVGEYITYA